MSLTHDIGRVTIAAGSVVVAVYVGQLFYPATHIANALVATAIVAFYLGYATRYVYEDE